MHCGLALTKGARTVNRRRLISKLDPKGASETLRLSISSEIGDRGISFLVSSTINEVVSSTPAPVYLGVVPNYEHNSEADVATNFLAVDSSCFSLNAFEETQPVSGETLVVYKGVCMYISYTCIYKYICTYIY